VANTGGLVGSPTHIDGVFRKKILNVSKRNIMVLWYHENGVVKCVI